jgi:hypothetical protein
VSAVRRMGKYNKFKSSMVSIPLRVLRLVRVVDSTPSTLATEHSVRYSRPSVSVKVKSGATPAATRAAAIEC